MHNKLTKQESWSLNKTLTNKIKSLEHDNRRLLDQQGFLHKILDNQKQMMKMLRSQKNTTATAKETESNLKNVPRTKLDRSEHFQFTKRQKKMILGSSVIARINPYEVLEDIDIQAYSGSTSKKELAITSKGEKKLTTVAIQDGTNSVLKHTNEDMFQHHQDLIKQIEANHEPEKSSFVRFHQILTVKN